FPQHGGHTVESRTLGAGQLRRTDLSSMQSGPPRLRQKVATCRTFPCYRTPGETDFTQRPLARPARRLTMPRDTRRSSSRNEIRVKVNTNLAAQHLEQNGDPVIVCRSVEDTGVIREHAC